MQKNDTIKRIKNHEIKNDKNTIKMINIKIKFK